MRWALSAVLAAALAPAAQAELVFYTTVPDARIETQAVLGAAPPGDFLDVRLRLLNTGPGAASVTTLKVSGTGFLAAGLPALPRVLAAGEGFDFTIRFQPSAEGAYSAALQADKVSAILVATAPAAPAVWAEQADGFQPLGVPGMVDFGTVERGSEERRRLRVENRTGRTLPLPGLGVEGEGFLLLTAPSGIPLETGAAEVFEVGFRPAAAGSWQGILTVGDRRILLRASGVEPPLPQPRVQVDLPLARSGQQGRVTVPLAAVSRTRAEGELRIEFQPAVAGARDPGIVFASGAAVARLAIAEGDSAARLDGQAGLGFQTGSTAGTLTFTVAVGPYRESQSIAIFPSPVGVTATRAARGQSTVSVEIAGLDNTRSAGELAFTFYDTSGAALAQGPVRVDAADAFRRFFDSSDLGGVFLMKAVFPVTGAADRIGAVEVEVFNAAGVARTSRIPF